LAAPASGANSLNPVAEPAANCYAAYLARAAGRPTQVRRYVYAWLAYMPVLWGILWLDYGRIAVLVGATLTIYTPLYFLVAVPLFARFWPRR